MFAIDYCLATGEATLQMPTELSRATYRPLSTAAPWRDSSTSSSPRTNRTSRAATKISLDLRPLPGTGPEWKRLASALTAVSDKHSMILTIVAALEAIMPGLGSREQLSLHLVGTASKELEAAMLLEEMLHQPPRPGASRKPSSGGRPLRRWRARTAWRRIAVRRARTPGGAGRCACSRALITISWVGEV